VAASLAGGFFVRDGNTGETMKRVICKSCGVLIEMRSVHRKGRTRNFCDACNEERIKQRRQKELDKRKEEHRQNSVLAGVPDNTEKRTPFKGEWVHPADVYERADEIIAIAKWRITRAQFMKRKVIAAVGSVTEFAHEVWMAMARNISEKPVRCSLTTATVNQCRWSLSRLFDKKSVPTEPISDTLTYEVPMDEIASRAELKKAVRQELLSMDARTGGIVAMRYGMIAGVKPLTLEEAGCVWKITRERVRQIELVAVKKLQHYTRAERFIGYCDTEPDFSEIDARRRMALKRQKEFEARAQRARWKQLSSEHAPPA